jgi:hypothetical protein
VELVERQALAAYVLGLADVERIRLQMEEAEARRLQPHYIRSFFLQGFRLLVGRAVEREQGRFELTHVPADLRSRDRQIGVGAPVLRRYERICFDKDQLHILGKPPAELVAPGHPLLDAVVDLLLERYGTLLRQGAVLVDDTDPGEVPRVLVYLEHAVTDARTDAHGNQRVVSRRFEFVELHADGTTATAGHAPYLDYRAATDDELVALKDVRNAEWLADDLEAARWTSPSPGQSPPTSPRSGRTPSIGFARCDARSTSGSPRRSTIGTSGPTNCSNRCRQAASPG